jgi:streptomycin 6-kinase
VAYEHLDEWRQHPVFGAWFEALPSLVESCANRWSLELGEPWTNSAASLTMPATRGTERLVLKIQLPDRDGDHEAEALRRWDGAGAVRLIDHDAHARALLLERCEPGTPVAALEPDRALDVMIGLVRRLEMPAGAPFRPLADEAAELTQEMLDHWEHMGRPVDQRLILAAAEAFEDLTTTQGEQVLVNQDLHADNVLAAQREPWLVIDPQPLAGEREFGVAAMVRGMELGHSRAAVLHRLHRVSSELGLEEDRVRRWTIAHTVSRAVGEELIPEWIEIGSWLLDSA